MHVHVASGDGEAKFWLEPETTNNDTVLVDALFGIGLTRPLHWNSVSWALLMCAANVRMNSEHWPSARVVAVDVPSGMDCDTGDYPTPDPAPFDFECAKANLTVTFHKMKSGHRSVTGAEHCGKIVVKDIGL